MNGSLLKRLRTMQLESYFKRINWSSSSKTFWQILAYLFKLLIKADMVWIWVKVKIKPHCMRLFPNERHHPLTIMLRVVTRDTMRVCLFIVFSLLQTLIDTCVSAPCVLVTTGVPGCGSRPLLSRGWDVMSDVSLARTLRLWCALVQIFPFRTLSSFLRSPCEQAIPSQFNNR